MDVEKKVREYFKKWEHIVTHFGWKFDVVYVEDERGFPEGNRRESVVMMVLAKFQYLEAKIWVNLAGCSKHEEDYWEEAVIHELVHVLLAPLDDFDIPEVPLEYMTTTLARVIKGVAG